MSDEEPQRLSEALATLADKVLVPGMGKRRSIQRLREALPRDLSEALLRLWLGRFIDRYRGGE
ncbi:MAG: hypothetical protein H0T47_08615 [Planctomycetaceae bacterium]|nr:hypothetical protein [Planctomycetaceae bacterium]